MDAIEVGIPRFSLPVNFNFKILPSIFNGFQSFSRYRGTPLNMLKGCNPKVISISNLRFVFLQLNIVVSNS